MRLERKTLAFQHWNNSKGKQSKENGGFVGIRFISEPMLKSNRLFLMRKKAK